MAVDKKAYIEALKREGWTVREVKLNHKDFPDIVTLNDVSAGTEGNVIEISPPSGSEVRILEDARFWMYLAGSPGTGEIGDKDDISIRKAVVFGEEIRIDSGIYSNFKQTDQEKIYRFVQPIKITASDKLLIKVTPSKAIDADYCKFGLDAILLSGKTVL